MKNKFKIKLTIEIELVDMIDLLDEEQKLWLENEILVGNGDLSLHSSDIGDTVGIVKKVSNVQYVS